MEDDIEDYEDEDQDSIEEELDKMDEKVKKPTPKSKQLSQGIPEKEEDKVQDTFASFHQPEAKAIINTLTNEVIAEGFKDDGIQMALTKIINMLDKISTATGAQ